MFSKMITSERDFFFIVGLRDRPLIVNTCSAIVQPLNTLFYLILTTTLVGIIIVILYK